jgi:hypothetical protein
MEWQNYPDERLIAHHPSGFSVIKPKIMNDSEQPLFCPLCESIMNSSYDDESYSKFECCDECAGTWAYPNKEKWKSGWRPTEEEIKVRYKNR